MSFHVTSLLPRRQNQEHELVTHVVFTLYCVSFYFLSPLEPDVLSLSPGHALGRGDYTY